VLFPVNAALAVAIVFYLLIPVVGAFGVRAQWRRFRKLVTELSLVPLFTYSDLAAAEKDGRTSLGLHRLYGRVEAIDRQHRIWVRGESVSALIDLSRAPLYVLSTAQENVGSSVERLAWRSVPSLAEGTMIFAAGMIAIEDGKPIFVDEGEEPLLVVCHDNEEGSLISSLIAAGRRANEYWNTLGRFSLALGLVLSSGFLVLMSRSIFFSAVRTLTFLAAIIPILPLAPPGLFLFLLYRRFWRQALLLRTTRDLIRLPLRYFTAREGTETDCAALAGGGYYVRRSVMSNENLPAGVIPIALPSSEDGEQDTRRSSIVLFEALDSSDPAVERIAVSGDPERVAEVAGRRAGFFAVLAGSCFGASVVLNYILAFLLWRFIR
jgi:hypothetical protein